MNRFPRLLKDEELERRPVKAAFALGVVFGGFFLFLGLISLLLGTEGVTFLTVSKAVLGGVLLGVLLGISRPYVVKLEKKAQSDKRLAFIVYIILFLIIAGIIAAVMLKS